MNTFKRIGVLTSGGDAPGMNAAIRAITRKALAEGLDVMGIMGGYSGLIHDKMIHLTTTSVSNIIKAGGTILNSDRCLEFKTEEGIQKAIETDVNAIIKAKYQHINFVVDHNGVMFEGDE